MQSDDTRVGVANYLTCADAYDSWAYSAHQSPITMSDGKVTFLTDSLELKTQATSYAIPSGCMSMCTIRASRVQLLYWPTPYSTPGNNATLTSASRPRISIGPDGFSFVSPTAYVIYSGVHAEAPAGFPGWRTYDNITQAYPPTQLSTFYSCNAPYGHSSQINFEDFNVPPRWSVISAHQNCDWCQQQYLYPDPQQPGDALVTGYANMNFDQIPWFGSGQSSWTLQPTLAAPPGLTDIDPYWKHCTSLYQGIWDPPRSLSAVAELTPTATEASTSPSASAAVPTSTAAPASLLISPLASPTGTPGAIEPDTSIQASKHSESPTTPTSSNEADPPAEAASSPWPADSPDDPKGASRDPAQATKGPLSGIRTGGMPPDSSLDPVLTQDPPSRPNLGLTATRSPDSSPQPSLRLTDGNSPTQSSKKWTTGHTTVDVIQGETGKASLGSISNIEGSPSSHTEFTTNLPRLTMTAMSHSISHIESPYLLLTISPSDDGALSHHIESAGAVKTTDRATGTLMVPSDNSLTATPHIGINAVGEIFTPINAHTVVVQDTSLSIGGEALTMHNVEVSVGNSGLVVGTTTIAVPSAGINPADDPKEQTDANHASTVTAGGLAWTFNGDSQIMAGGVTLTKQSHAIMSGGTSFSFGSTALFADTATIPMPVAAAATSHGSLSTAVGPTIEDQLGRGEVLWSGITITEGASAITIHGSPVSYGSSGLIIGTSSIAIPSKTADPSEVITLSAAGLTFTPVSNSLLVVDKTTLSVGFTAR